MNPERYAACAPSGSRRSRSRCCSAGCGVRGPGPPDRFRPTVAAAFYPLAYVAERVAATTPR